MTTIVLTEVLPFTVDESCGDGIFLRWENDSGAVDQWYFKGNIAENPEIGDAIYFEKYVDDLLNTTSNFEVTQKSYAESITAYAEFDKDNAEGFKQLMRSRQIEMYVLGVFYQIDIRVVNFNVKKYNPFGKITIEIILPKKYIK